MFLLTATCTLAARAQSFTVMSFNCENAFDTIHDTGKNDTDFLPDGLYRWNSYRMKRKLRDIAKVVMAVDSVSPAACVGLVEVENDSVLEMLTKRGLLRNIGYRYIITNSQDRRGIDVALLYQPLRFKPLSHRCIRGRTSTPTRDILAVDGLMNNSDTLHLYVVHLPSKRGGGEARQNRNIMVKTLLADIDSVRMTNGEAKCIIMGDFNDELNSKNNLLLSAGMTDVVRNAKPGTYKYQGVWSTIDHLLISQSLKSMLIDGGIAALPFMLVPDETNGGQKPHRTFLGPRYIGGISDHLPVWGRFNTQNK